MIDLGAGDKITLYAIIWGGLLVYEIKLVGDSRYDSVGLMLAFFVSYTAAHAGALVHLVEGYTHNQYPYLRGLSYTSQTVADGLEASCLAMIGATIGSFIVVQRMSSGRAVQQEPFDPYIIKRGSIILLLVGAAFVGLETLGDPLPGLQAVMSNAVNLFVVGACGILLCYGEHGSSMRSLFLTGTFIAALPILHLLTTAILAGSVTIAIALMAFHLATKRTRTNEFARNLIVFTASFVFALIFAVAYLQSRSELRTVVWGGGSVGSAAQTVLGSARSFDVTSVFDFDSLALLDARLDQNILVGLAIEQLRAFPDTYGNGNTIFLALLGWVPRFIWPSKPERGGSSLVEDYTGRRFSKGTTVGAGPVFEFYVNFGYIGVVVGFFCLGILVRTFDIFAARALRSGRLAHFAQYYLPGVALLDPLDDLFFLVTAVTSALIIGLALRQVWTPART